MTIRIGLGLALVASLAAAGAKAQGPRIRSGLGLRAGSKDQRHGEQGGGLERRENVILNLGLGLGVTDAGNRTVLKARLGWMF